MECPNCGIEIPIEDVRPDGFQCSRCGDHFRRAVRGGRVAGIAILFFACFLCYAAGVRGGEHLSYRVGGLCVYWSYLPHVYLNVLA